MKKTSENSEQISKKNKSSSINNKTNETNNNLASVLAIYHDDFTSIRSSDFAEALIKNHQISYLVSNLSDFRWLSNDIAYQLIDLGYGKDVTKNIQCFSRIEWEFDSFLFVDDEHSKIAKKLIESGYGKDVIEYLYRFLWVDHNVIASYLINNGYGRDVALNIWDFKEPSPFNHKKIVDTLIDMWYWDIVLEKINFCNWLDLETKKKFIEKWFWSRIKHLSSCFKATI